MRPSRQCDAGGWAWAGGRSLARTAGGGVWRSCCKAGTQRRRARRNYPCSPDVTIPRAQCMQGLCQGLLSFQDMFNLIILFACSTKQTLHRWCIRRKFEWQASAAQQPRRPNLHGPFLRQPLALSQGSTPPTGSRPHLGAKMAQGAANAPTLFPEHMTDAHDAWRCHEDQVCKSAPGSATQTLTSANTPVGGAWGQTPASLTGCHGHTPRYQQVMPLVLRCTALWHGLQAGTLISQARCAHSKYMNPHAALLLLFMRTHPTHK